jgi:maltose alpha-D-glucosyltransferase / alpha-amylase
MGHLMVNCQSRLNNPLWYKEAIIYELRIRSFYDSNGDGIGDFPGLIEKLDYLQELGVDTLWLLPFYPSPLKDDGYDISDYYTVHPDYGTLKDFKKFLKEAHDRGLNVITEMVLNHTSDQHAWFKKARQAKPGSSARQFYVWNQTPDRYQEARIIFKDFERSNWTFDEKADAYYWHRFYSHQPDLNYDHPAVRQAIFKVVDFWLELGVDGMRLDTIPYLFEREGTSCENLPETHAFIKELRHHIDTHFDHRMLLAEANQWPTDSVAYFGEGDECHMAFHFSIMPRLFMSVQLEDCFPLFDIIQQTPAIPEIAQWALFLRNHDELTLEMVTDEERDYMYRLYAQDPQARLNLGIRRRLAPLLKNDRRKIELLNGILFSFPGSPIIYYADEIGMGDNIYLGDRDGVRTPMQWNADRNAGFSTANPQRLCLPVVTDAEYNYAAINVENQQQNPYSLLQWMKRLINVRKQFKSFGLGSIEFIQPKNGKILTFVRQQEQEVILVVANFSSSVQHVELDLAEYENYTPVELFGQTPFPLIGQLPYLLTLGPYAFYWFSLENQQVKERRMPLLKVSQSWKEIFNSPFKNQLENGLLNYLQTFAWFKPKQQPFTQLVIQDKIPIYSEKECLYLMLIKIESDQTEKSFYLLPLGFTQQLQEIPPEAWIASIQSYQNDQGFLYDAFCDPKFFKGLLEAKFKHKKFKGILGQVFYESFQQTKFSSSLLNLEIKNFKESIVNVKINQSHVLKMFRCIAKGVNPEIEVEQFLTHQQASFVPSFQGTFIYQSIHQQRGACGFIHSYIPEEKTAWDYILDELNQFFENPVTYNVSEAFKQKMCLIGQVTARMHLTLANDQGVESFKPKGTTPFYLRSNFQSKRHLVTSTCQKLEFLMESFTLTEQELAQQIIASKNQFIQLFYSTSFTEKSFERIRCHGDYLLENLLFTGEKVFVINFEQNNEQSFDERRRKRSALRDVASLLYSIHVVTYYSLKQQQTKQLIKEEEVNQLFVWKQSTLSLVVNAYLKEVKDAPFIPHPLEVFKTTLHLYSVEKAWQDLSDRLSYHSHDITTALYLFLSLVKKQ